MSMFTVYKFNSSKLLYQIVAYTIATLVFFFFFFFFFMSKVFMKRCIVSVCVLKIVKGIVSDSISIILWHERRYKQKMLISKISVDSDFTFSSY